MIKINKERFLRSLSRCLPGVEKGISILEGADTFAFEKGFVHSYNDSISVSVFLGDEFKDLQGSVKADEFFKIISKLPLEEFQLSLEENFWRIEFGKAKVELNVRENVIEKFVQEISRAEEEKNWKEVASNFTDALKSCKMICNNSTFAGVYVEKNIMTSIDTRKINWYEMDKEMGKFWITDASVSELLKLSEVKKWAVSDSWVHFVTEEKVYFSCRKLMEENFCFGKIKELMDKYEKNEKDISGNLPSGFEKVVDRASSLSMDIDDYEAIRIKIGPGMIECSSERHSGKYMEKIEWQEDNKRDFDPVEIYLDYSTIAYGLKRSSKFYIKEVKKREDIYRRIAFYNDAYKHIVATYKKGK